MNAATNVPAVRDPWALVPSLGNLDAYIGAVNRVPLLTQEEETEFARRLRDHDDLAAAGRLVVSHLRLVVSISRKYLGYGLPHGDLIQEGNIGLMKAVKRFDPDQGVRLVSYAIHWIRAEIHEYILKNWRMVKVATTKAQRKLFFNLRSMKQSLKDDAADDDTHRTTLTQGEVDTLATSLNVKREEVLEMETRMTGHDLTLDPTPSDDDEHAYSPIAYLTDADDEPATIVEAKQTAERRSEGLSHALGKLDPRSRRIIEARWLREENPLTLQELANEYNVSAERIRQIESKAIKQMKGAMAAAA
jgi:RNA polymerase sigma-32 factor